MIGRKGKEKIHPIHQWQTILAWQRKPQSLILRVRERRDIYNVKNDAKQA